MKLSGVLPAVVTPFDSNERFLAASFEKLLERVYAAGVDGIYVCGQTGEGMLQPVEQRKRVAEVAVKNSPAGKQVIVHTGAPRTADAIELTRHASSLGVAAVSSLPPAGVYSFAEVQAYYQAVAPSATVPFLIYYFPNICPAIASADQVLELLKIPNVIGLKFTDMDMYKLMTLKATGCTLFNGYDEVLVAGLLMGADGGIGTFYNLVPELFLKIYRLAREQRWAEARAVQERVDELIRLTLRFPALSAVKHMLSVAGVPCGPCMAPRSQFDAQAKDGLRAALAKSSFANADFAAF